MSAEVHPFDAGVATNETHGAAYGIGNAAYYEWLSRTIKAATGGGHIDWTAVEVGISLDRVIRTHEAEAKGGPKCDECLALDALDGVQA